MGVNGIDPRQIDPAYRRVFTGWLDGQLGDAADDQAELAAVNRLLLQMEAGQLIIDDLGRQHALAGEAVYNDVTVAARLRQWQTAAGKARREKAVGVLLLLGALAVLFFAFGGLDLWKGATPEAEPVEVVVEEGDLAPTPSPTPIRESVLELADNLGGRVRLGQPRTIEIRRQGAVEGVTLAIVPAQVDDKGVIRYFQPDQAEAEGTAVWVFGTVLNYVFGIAEETARQLQLGDTVVMRSATGAVYAFAIVETLTAEPQQVEIFSQRQSPGLTLFALPASDKTIPVARAIYLAANEELAGLSALAALGERTLAAGQPFTATTLTVDEGLDGLLTIRVSGQIGGVSAPGDGANDGGAAASGHPQPLLLSLLTPAGQYGAASGGQLAPPETAAQDWTAVWELPAGFVFGGLRLRVDSLYGPATTIDLGSPPLPGEAVRATITGAVWNETRAELVVSLLVVNSGPGVARLDAAQIIISQQGGELPLIIQPYLPLLLPPGGETAVVARTRPPLPGLPLILQAGSQRWELEPSLAASLQTNH